MLVGRFGNTSGRPYLEGRLLFPRLGLRGDLSFLVDTGADATYLMPGDARVLGLDHSQLRPAPRSSYGVGGAVRPFQEQAVLVFADDAQRLCM